MKNIELELFDEKLLNNEDANESYKYRIGIDIRSICDLSNSFNSICKYKCILFVNLLIGNIPVCCSLQDVKIINNKNKNIENNNIK